MSLTIFQFITEAPQPLVTTAINQLFERNIQFSWLIIPVLKVVNFIWSCQTCMKITRQIYRNCWCHNRKHTALRHHKQDILKKTISKKDNQKNLYENWHNYVQQITIYNGIHTEFMRSRMCYIKHSLVIFSQWCHNKCWTRHFFLPHWFWYSKLTQICSEISEIFVQDSY